MARPGSSCMRPRTGRRRSHALLGRADITVDEIYLERATLDDVFRRITTEH